eukprot:762428-Hanusia_phi.AAC.5
MLRVGNTEVVMETPAQTFLTRRGDADFGRGEAPGTDESSMTRVGSKKVVRMLKALVEPAPGLTMPATLKVNVPGRGTERENRQGTRQSVDKRRERCEVEIVEADVNPVGEGFEARKMIYTEAGGGDNARVEQIEAEGKDDHEFPISWDSPDRSNLEVVCG